MFKQSKNRFETLKAMLFAPKLEQEDTQAQLLTLKSSLPIPVVWLFGKTQSGKTSIIKALTHQNDIEIGNGFEACTKFSTKYAFPTSQEAFIHFLDTKGIGEIDYNPAEDIAFFEQHAHILMVVVKALDSNLESMLKHLQTITQNKNYPIIVVQTTIHEGYEDITMEHIQPYPFETFANVPNNLSRPLLQQRELFKHNRILVQKFVVVDLTKPQDGYINPNYGLEALWEAIEEVFPYGIRSLMMDNFGDIYASKAHPHIITHAILSSASELIPLPMASIPIVTSIQAKMLHSIASIYNQKLDVKIITELSTALGGSFVFSLLGRQLVKLIPLYGSAFNALYTGAITYALGRLLCIYFNRTKEGEMLTKSQIRTLFKVEFERGKAFLKPYMQSLTDNTKPKI
jgi:uncharacterized protein (DUF697 family)